MIRSLALILAVAIVAPTIGVAIFDATSAQAAPTSPPTEEEVKKEWQDRYRDLLRNQARLEFNAKNSRENYARAKRRNYPRGGALEQFLLDANAADKELVGVKASIEQIFIDARLETIPPNWLYAVEDEKIPAIPAAAAAGRDTDEQEQDREGRNPLYFKDDSTQP